MFGVLRGASCGLDVAGRREWMGQICGVCLALGQEHGQLARLATSYDAALLAALVEAQQPDEPARRRHLCPLRPGLAGDVPVQGAVAQRYGAAAALLIAAARIADDMADGERYARIPGAAALGLLAARRAARSLAELGIDPEVLADPGATQAALEAAEQQRDPDSRGTIERCAEPTAQACGVAFAQTAELSGRPAAAPALQRAGRAYGRIIYLLDALRDARDDLARGRFNPLHALGTAAPAAVAASFREWHAELREALVAAALPRPGLALVLLDGGLRRAYRAARSAGELPADPRRRGRRLPGEHNNWCGDCCSGWQGCEGCCDCGGCCCDGLHCCGKGDGCCGCDCGHGCCGCCDCGSG